MKLIKEIPNLSGLSCLNGLNGKPNSEQLFNRPPEGLDGGGGGLEVRGEGGEGGADSPGQTMPSLFLSLSHLSALALSGRKNLAFPCCSSQG